MTNACFLDKVFEYVCMCESRYFVYMSNMLILCAAAFFCLLNVCMASVSTNILSFISLPYPLQIIRLFIYIKEHHGMLTAFKFLGNVSMTSTPSIVEGLLSLKL